MKIILVCRIDWDLNKLVRVCACVRACAFVCVCVHTGGAWLGMYVTYYGNFLSKEP